MKRITQPTATIECPHCGAPMRYTNSDTMTFTTRHHDGRETKELIIYCHQCQEPIQVKKII